VADIGAVTSLRGPVYVHLDLDVLDPGCFGGISCPEPAGVAPAQLATVLAQIPNVVGASITEHAPLADTARRDAEALRALIAALDRS
jgi:arginase